MAPFQPNVVHEDALHVTAAVFGVGQNVRREVALRGRRTTIFEVALEVDVASVGKLFQVDAARVGHGGLCRNDDEVCQGDLCANGRVDIGQLETVLPIDEASRQASVIRLIHVRACIGATLVQGRGVVHEVVASHAEDTAGDVRDWAIIGLAFLVQSVEGARESNDDAVVVFCRHLFGGENGALTWQQTVRCSLLAGGLLQLLYRPLLQQLGGARSPIS
mmetsp:Transcript_46258/g.100571  ORF Transcript_46258/g.100571 Transcript_46258/m.100571 type:complete len:219 (+) Transcript_46258:857-1513(+)